MKFTIFGSTNLATYCIECLLKNNHQIIAVVYFDEILKTWALANNLPAYSFNEFTSKQSNLNTDYILSIVTPIYLNKNIIKLAKSYAINYHDSLLPKYAGLNATSWAIMYDEKKHGITWHIMDTVIDAGEILLQHTIPIDKKETTISLNVKCYEAAKLTFSKILELIENNQLILSKQNLTGRSLYRSYDIPPNFGFIDFKSPGHKIDLIGRALSFGAYNNTLGTFKIAIGNNFFILDKWEILYSAHNYTPGTIVNISSLSIDIAAVDSIVQISLVKNIHNITFTGIELSNMCGLEKMNVLSTNYKKYIESLGKQYRVNSKQEQYWLTIFTNNKSIKNNEPLQNYRNHNCSYSNMEYQINLPKHITGISNYKEYCLSLIIICSAHYNLDKNIWISHENNFHDYFSYFSGILPLTLNSPDNIKFHDLFKHIIKKVEIINSASSYSRDIAFKYPKVEIHSQLENYTNGLIISLNANTAEEAKDALMTINILENSVKIIDNVNAFGKQLSEQIEHLLQFDFLNPKLNIDQIETIPSKTLKLVENYNKTADKNLLVKSDTRLEKLFSSSVHDYPNNCAIIDQNLSFTYKEMDVFSTNIALYLVEIKNSHNGLIAIYLEKSWQQIATVIGILKAGYTFIPLSVEDPIDRIQQIIKEVKLSIIITNKKYNRFISKTSCQFYDVSDLIQNKSTHVMQTMQNATTAYIIFTSGSTGTPKGIRISHQSAINTILDINNKFKITSKDVIFGISRLNFDLAIFDIFGAFAAGATLVIVKQQDLRNPDKWLQLILKYKVTIWNSVPALMQMLMEYKSVSYDQLIPHLRLILLSGDYVPYQLPSKIIQHLHTNAEVISLGGATEASIWSIYYRTQDLSLQHKYIPYGKPLANQTIYILDRFMRIQPLGIPGEIYIGGIGVAEGYIANQKLNHIHFIEHNKYARLYKTGDIGRLHEDGNVEFIGRYDNQVKIHGMRIELGEIEAVTRKTTNIHDVKAILFDNKNIVVFIKDQESKIHKEAATLNALNKKLPGYMHVKNLLTISQWPLTNNGKCDIDQLKILAKNIITTEVEQNKLSTVRNDINSSWQSILNLDFLPQENANFFSLGGDSILSIKLMHLLNQKGYTVNNEDIFHYPILSEFETKIKDSAKVKNADYNEKISIRQTNTPLSQSQLGILFHYLKNHNNNEYMVQVSVSYMGKINPRKYKNAWQELISNNITLRSHIVKQNSTYTQSIMSPFKIPFHYLDWTQPLNSELDNFTQLQNFLKEEQNNTFNLFEQIPYRIYLIKLSNHNYTTIFSVHHILLDGWSISLIFNYLHKIYNYGPDTNGLPSWNVLEKTYFEYTNWLNNLSYKSMQEFWQKQLNNVDSLSKLPIYKKSINNKSGSQISSKKYSLSKLYTNKLKHLANNHHDTIANIIQACWSYVLAHYTNQSTVIYGLATSGRSIPIDITNNIGMFINVAPMIVEIDPKENLQTLTKKIANTTSQIEFNGLLGLANIQQLAQFNMPLFDHVLIFTNYDTINDIVTEEISISSVKITERTHYPLNIYIDTQNQKLCINLTYDTAAFKVSIMNNLGKHLLNAIKFFINTPLSPLSSIDILSKTELKQLILSPQNKKIKITESVCDIYKYILKISQDLPNKVAVRLNHDKSYTYGELIKISTQISRNYLGQDESVVAIYLPRDILLIATIISALQCKIPYLLISHDTPPKRVIEMCKEAKCNHLITSNDIENKLSNAIPNIHIINDIMLSRTCSANFTIDDKQNNTAYIIFTSGTTAKPKGVSISYAGLINCLLSFKGILDVQQKDILLATTPVSFDISQLELLLPLISGASLILCDDAAIKDPDKIIAVMQKYSPTIMQTTPSKWQALLASGLYANFPKKIICGGEVLSQDLAINLLKVVPHGFWNAYGPTETTIWSSVKFITDSLQINVGKPIFNTKILVLNQFYKPMPQGVTGELYIGGIGVAEKYINASNASFLKINGHSETFYKTGDYAYIHNTEVFYVGRKDRQIKLRGHRIELGEIEYSIKQIPGVKAVHVIFDSNEQKLVAFYQSDKALNPLSTFSLFYFAQINDDYAKGYEFFLNSAKLADKLQLEAIWIPERHFSNVGSLFPNPAVLAASVATITKNIKIRAGSVVLPLHDSIRVAEEWAIVDNLSVGRIGIAFGSGWHQNDFVLAPDKFTKRKEIFNTQLEEVLKLWSGAEIERYNGLGQNTKIAIYPKPLQKSLPYWITAADSDATFELAGKLGANLLTHMLMHNIESLKQKIIIYKTALLENGFNPHEKRITLMIHTFIHSNAQTAHDIAFSPFKLYLKQHLGLLEKLGNNNKEHFSNQEYNETFLNAAANRLIKERSFIGSTEHCAMMATQLSEIGVNEFACLIDFGIDYDKVLDSIELISQTSTLLKPGHSATHLSAESIYSYLSANLPHYMLPNNYYHLEEFPLTAHGKLDQNVLLKLSQDHTDLQQIECKQNELLQSMDVNFISPYKEKLQYIWKSVLKINNITYKESFFSLGGHSLKAIQVINKINSEFNIQFPLEKFLQNPTINQQVKILEQLINNDNYDKAEVLKLESHNIYDAVNLSYAQEGLWFMHNMEPESPRYNDSFTIFIDGVLDTKTFNKALTATIKHHQILNSYIYEIDSVPYQRINPNGVTNLEIHYIEDIDKILSANTEAMIKKFANMPFILENELVRFLLLVGETKAIFVLSIHHIITDGYSFKIFLSDFISYYDSLKTTNQANIISPKYNYYDYVIWERSNFTKNKIQTDLKMFKQNHVLPDPITYTWMQERPNKLSYNGSTYIILLDNNFLAAITKAASRHNCSTYVFMLASFIVSLKTITNDKSIALGLPYANRDNGDLNNVIGCFVNLIYSVLNLNHLEQHTLESYLTSILNSILEAYSFRQLPFSALTDALKIKRYSNSHPIFQIIFGMFDAKQFPEKFSDMDYQILDLDFGVARYDLEVQVITYQQQNKIIFRYNKDIFSEDIISNFYTYFINTLESFMSSENNILLKNIIDENKPKNSLRDISALATNKTDIKHPLIEKIIVRKQNQEINVTCLPKIDFKRRNMVTETWKEIYSKLYFESLNITHKFPGWVSSYTKQNIPTREMNEWLNNTILRLLVLNPSKILEIGCGTGLLTNELVKHGQIYDGIDSSPESIKYLKTHFKFNNNINLYTSEANKIHTLGLATNYDTIILNSVAQYFPDIFYLTETLIGALALIEKGYIFIGDLKNNDLLDTLYNDIEFQNASPNINLETILSQAQQKISKQLELSVSPALFYNLQKFYLKITSIKILPKVGKFKNELNDFRYDVILEIGGRELHHNTITQLLWKDISSKIVNISKIVNLAKKHTLPLLLYKIPNTRFILQSYILTNRDSDKYSKLNVTANLRDIDNGCCPYEMLNTLHKAGFNAEVYYNVEDPLYFDLAINTAGQNIFYQQQIYEFKIINSLETYSNIKTLPVNVGKEIYDQIAPLYSDNKLTLHISNLNGLPPFDSSSNNHASSSLTECSVHNLENAAVIKDSITMVWKEILNLEYIDPEKTFFELGGDSIMSIQMISRIKQANINITPQHFFKHQKLNSLIDFIINNNLKNNVTYRNRLRSEPFNLSPIQTWLFEQNLCNISHWNQAFLLDIITPIKDNQLENILNNVFNNYDVFKLCFKKHQNGQWQQQYQKAGNKLIVLEKINLAEYIIQNQIKENSISKLLAPHIDRFQSSLDILKGQLCKVALINLGKYGKKLLIIIHNSVMDGVSWRILFDDLAHTWHNDKNLTIQSSDYFAWVQELTNYINSSKSEVEKHYWSSIANFSNYKTLWPNNHYIFKQQKIKSIKIGSKTLSKLKNNSNVLIQDFILAAFVEAIGHIYNVDELLIDLEHHGRENISNSIDISRTIGWFTSIYPVLLKIDKYGISSTLKMIKEQLRKIPNNGIGYFALKYLNHDKNIKTQLNSIPRPQIAFNYFGDMQKSFLINEHFKVSKLQIASYHDQQNSRPHIFHCNAVIIDKCVLVEFRYPAILISKQIMDTLANRFISNLHDLAN